MDFNPSSTNIFFNNKFSPKRSQRRTVCLNPNCKVNRLCQDDGESDLVESIHREHQACRGWIHNIDTLKKWHYKQEGVALGSYLMTDYLQNPIQSIYYMKRFASVKWEDQLFSYFQRIRVSIQDELGKIYIQCQRTINDHLSVNHQIYAKLQGFYERGISSEATVGQYYDKYLKNDLKNIQKVGKIIISNNELMNRSLDSIVDELKGIQNSIWSKQFNFDVVEKIKEKVRQGPAEIKKELNVMDLNNKLHEISMKLKVSVNFVQADGGLNLVCWFCPKKIHSKAAVVKMRKQQCRNDLFQHLIQSHLKQMSSFSLVPSLGIVEPSTRLSLEQMKREIIVKNMRKVVIIDKQNVGPFKCDDMQNYQSYYFINVVSQHTESTVRGRYLLAQTKGRDAADILITIMITELKKFKLQQIVLLTKDHFGETLREIFEKMGTKIIISKTHQFLNKPKNDPSSMNLLDL